jgi:hemerythrin
LHRLPISESGKRQITFRHHLKAVHVPRIKWDDKYLIGIEEIDEQHKHLVSLTNELYEMFLSCGCSNSNVQAVLEALAEYTIDHFTTEENLMARFEYPQREEHRQDHQKFVLRISEFNEHLKDGTEQLTLDIISFLRVWLLTHIFMVDSKCGEFIRQKQHGAAL